MEMLLTLCLNCTLLNAITINVDIHNESSEPIQLGYTRSVSGSTTTHYDNEGNQLGKSRSASTVEWFSQVTVPSHRTYRHSEEYGGWTSWFYYPSIFIKDIRTGAISGVRLMPVLKSGKVIDYSYSLSKDRWLFFARHSTSFTDDAVNHIIRIG